MEQILKPNGVYLNVLGRTKEADSQLRLSNYCVCHRVDEGVLLLHTLTRELLLLTAEEYDRVLELDYLKKNWFVVPQDLNEYQSAKSVIWFNRTMTKKASNFTTYTILPTTDCNARCFYCFEMGRAHISMSDETALKTARYICDHCGGQEVLLRWFGGEPLYNSRVIDLISDELKKSGVAFSAKMVSNGYLFDDALVSKAVQNWNLKQVQITLDGTEEIYNRCKAYIYKQGSAYQVVMANIQRLLDAGVRVLVRMNLDFHNISDLKELTEELGRRFGKRRNLFVYPYLIFDNSISWEERYTAEQWKTLYTEQENLNQQLLDLGLFAFRGQRIKNTLQVNHCIADSDSSVVVLPDGKLCCCENYADEEVIGHLDQPALDQSVIDRWRVLDDEIPPCQTCFYYPECVRLKKCPDHVQCNEFERDALRHTTVRSMENEYRYWKKQK